MKKQILYSSILILVAFVGSALAAKTTTQTPSVYQKPGAPVVFDHNYDGKTKIGEKEIAVLRFTPSQDLDELEIKFTAMSETLEVESTDFAGKAVSGETIELPIGFKSDSNGRHFIGVTVIAREGSAKSTRGFALSVNVGDQIQSKPELRKISGSSVKVVNALETIH